MGFYRRLGHEVMPHFDPSRSTTSDVVRGAIIPLSRDSRQALSIILMGGVPTLPDCMVTHGWSNTFRHLVSAVVSDALGTRRYDQVAWALDEDRIDVFFER